MNATAFAPSTSMATSSRASPLYVFGKKKEEIDFSDIEVRDLTREEMLEINKKNEDVMNMELGMMVSSSNRKRQGILELAVG